MKLEQERSWVKIKKNALKQNLANLSRLTNKDVLKMVIVKSNAYGHGMIACAEIFAEAGADFLGVDSFAEAVALRKAGIKKPILVLGWTSDLDFAEASAKKISLTISNFDSLKALVKVAKVARNFSGENKIKIHIKIDTGLHRQGFAPEEIQQVIKILQKSPKLELEGLYSHFASAETPNNSPYTQKQISIFTKCADIFAQHQYYPLKHIGASAATMLYPESHFDMVRFGISAYGLWPSQEVREHASKKIKLTPALSWQAVVSEIKKVKKGEPIGYDCSEKLDRDSVIAIIPVGYWHGIPRHASKKGEVLINGKPAKILGKVSMDMIIVDATDCGLIKPKTIATIIGKDGKNEIGADNWAEKAETINYEIVTRINPQITRIYY